MREKRAHNVGVAGAHCPLADHVARAVGGNALHRDAERFVARLIVAVVEKAIP